MKPEPWITLRAFDLFSDGGIQQGDGVVLVPTGQVIARLWSGLIPSFGSYRSTEQLLRVHQGIRIEWVPERDPLLNLELD